MYRIYPESRTGVGKVKYPMSVGTAIQTHRDGDRMTVYDWQASMSDTWIIET
jgi:hypothetical protein